MSESFFCSLKSFFLELGHFELKRTAISTGKMPPVKPGSQRPDSKMRIRAFPMTMDVK